MNKYAKSSEDKSRVIDMAQCGLGASREGACDVELMPDAEEVYGNFCKYSDGFPTDDPFCIGFLEGLPKFRWFIEKHFGAKRLKGLVRTALDGKSAKLDAELVEIWYMLPDHIFNTKKNPSGWKEFVDLIQSSGR